MKFNTATDTELIFRLQKGESLAFREIYDRYWLKLFRIGYSELGSKEEAEELIHNIFENLWRKHAQLQIKVLEAYLVVSVKNAVTNYIKANISKRKYKEYLILSEINQSSSTDEFISYMDLSKAIDEALKKLPEKTCEVFKLSRFENQSVEEIATTLHLSKKAVEYHITKSLKLLREELKTYYFNN